MILVVSTSSPWVSVALCQHGIVVAQGRSEARQAASRAVSNLVQGALAEAGTVIDEVEAFVADVGPGSFSGIKVGVSMVKAWGWSMGRLVAGVPAFDLVDSGRPVAVPVRRGLWLVRDPVHEPETRFEPPPGAAGYGWEDGVDYPDAARADLSRLSFVQPAELLPLYLVEPSVSVPKNPSILRGAG